jgi:deazaflavin-dependent oxidoreductase (nitroreductase family)
MALLDLVIRFAASDTGRAVDRFAVRWTGESLMNAMFSRLTHSAYNKPLLLTTIGAKTGQKRTVVLPFFDVDGRIVVVGSRGGMPEDPFWARNMRVNPRIWIRIDRKLRDARAHLATGEERQHLWDAITAREKVYIAYQEKAKPYRELPFFVLTPGAK